MKTRLIKKPHCYSFYINTLFCVKESPKKSSCRGAGPLADDLIEIMANLFFYLRRAIFSSSSPTVMTINNIKPGKTFNPDASEEDETDAE
jgi:hypothetical protein